MLFIKIIGLIILFFFFVFLLLNILYRRTNHNKNFFENSEKFVAGVPKELEIVCTGSSYAKFGIDFNLSDYRGFNFGVFPQSLNYDYKILQQYKNHMKNGCVVLITLAPLVFGFVDYENDTANYKYYRFLHKKYINHYKFTTKISHIWLPLLATPKLVKYIFHDVPLNQYHNHIASEEHSRKEAEIRMNGWCEQFRLKDLKNPEVSEQMRGVLAKTTEILNQMVSFCEANQFVPVIVIPPVSNSLYRLFSKEFLDVYLYRNIKRTKQTATVLDYLGNTQLSDIGYYSNSDFMNQEGRQLFMQLLIKELISQDLLHY